MSLAVVCDWCWDVIERIPEHDHAAELGPHFCNDQCRGEHRTESGDGDL